MDIAHEILDNYEANLGSISRHAQRHFAQRLYRITGDEKYIPANVAYARSLVKQLQRDFEGINKPGYAIERSRRKLEKRELDAEGYDDEARREKYRERNRVLREWGEIPFASSLLFRLSQINAFGLLDSELFKGHESALGYLRSIDFREFLTDPSVLTIYAAQVANIAHYLHQLRIFDLRREATAAFQNHYSEDKQDGLSTADFRNLIYGMTHFVIADSGYYQRHVDASEYAWVLHRLEKSVDRILEAATADIQAEVGLCFALCGQLESEVVGRMKESLLEAYNPEARMIPSEAGGSDLGDGEHRNVLAIMLFRWPDVLHPGPALGSWLNDTMPESAGTGRSRFLGKLARRLGRGK